MAVYKNENGQVVKYAGSSSNIIDSALSSESTNAVQNKAIKEKFDSVDSAISTNTTNITSLKSGKVDKVSGKGLSTNDYTTSEKSKLGSLNSTLLNKLGTTSKGKLTYNGSEVNEITDYVVDTVAEAQAAIDNGLVKEGETIYVKEDSDPFTFKGSCLSTALPSSGNNVNDTYYCTDTKCRMTWNGGAWYQSSLSETEYTNELNGLTQDISELNAKKITKFYASNLGNTTVNDSDSGKFTDMMLYGKSEQKQYSGKNLLDIDNVEITSGIKDSSGASSENWYKHFKITLQAGKYVIKENKGSVYFLRLIRVYNATLNTNIYSGGLDLTISEYAFELTEQADIWFTFGKSLTENTESSHKEFTENQLKAFHIQLEEGETASSYEPYVGGIPSPNPDYPQEIKSVVNPVVKVVGKNLLKPTLETTTRNGVTCTANGDGTYTLNGTATEWTDFVFNTFGVNELNKIIGYKLIGAPNIDSNFGLRFVFFNSAYVEIASVWDKGNGAIITNYADAKSINLCISVKAGLTLNNVVIKPMITTDLNATYDDYVPYQGEQTAALPYTLNAIPVESGGNVTIDGQQYIADYVDFEKKQLVRMVGKFNARAVTWEKDAGWSGDDYATYSCNLSNVHVRSMCTCLSDRYLGKARSNYDSSLRNVIMSTTNGACIEIVGVSQLTLTEWNTFIRENDVNIYYVHGAPETIDLTDEEVRAFRDLATYYPTTNVFVSSDQLDGYTTFNYPLNMANGWNYVMQQIEETRPIIYNTQVDVLENRIDTAILEAKMEV